MMISEARKAQRAIIRNELMNDVAQVLSGNPMRDGAGRRLSSPWQLFVHDPSGVQLELTFEAGGKGEEKPDMSPGQTYIAGASLFDAPSFPKLASPI